MILGLPHFGSDREGGFNMEPLSGDQLKFFYDFHPVRCNSKKEKFDNVIIFRLELNPLSKFVKYQDYNAIDGLRLK